MHSDIQSMHSDIQSMYSDIQSMHSDIQSMYSERAVLETTETERDIGVLVSAGMKPARQCLKAAQMAGSVLGQISRAFHYRDRKTFVKLYKQYVRPHLEFAVTAWSPWTVADKESLERVQRRAVKMISGLASNDYQERLAELGMETLEERRHSVRMKLNNQNF